MAQIETWEREEAEQAEGARRDLEQQLAQVTLKLERLLDAHLDGLVGRDEYLPRKARLVEEKVALQDRLAELAGSAGNGRSGTGPGRLTSFQIASAPGGTFRFEPMRAFFQAIFHADSVARSDNFAEIADFLKLSGSNLTLAARQPHCVWVPPWSVVAHRPPTSNWWAFQAAARTHFQRLQPSSCA